MIEVTVSGLEEIERAFGHLGVQVDRRIVRVGLQAGAEVYRNGMSARAPEDTGLLKTSITYQIVVSPKAVVARIGPSREAFYGSFRELGTRFQDPKAFMRPTLFDDGPAAINAFADAARAEFDRLNVTMAT